MNKEIRNLLALDSGGGDEWGWANSHMFAICDVLYANGETIPASWEYRNPWPREHVLDRLTPNDYDDGEWPACEYRDMYQLGEITADDLRRAGEVLTRYIRRWERCNMLEEMADAMVYAAAEKVFNVH